MYSSLWILTYSNARAFENPLEHSNLWKLESLNIRASEYSSLWILESNIERLEYSQTRIFKSSYIQTRFQISEYCITIQRLAYSKTRLKSLKMYTRIFVYSILWIPEYSNTRVFENSCEHSNHVKARVFESSRLWILESLNVDSLNTRLSEYKSLCILESTIYWDIKHKWALAQAKPWCRPLGREGKEGTPIVSKRGPAKGKGGRIALKTIVFE